MPLVPVLALINAQRVSGFCLAQPVYLLVPPSHFRVLPAKCVLDVTFNVLGGAVAHCPVNVRPVPTCSLPMARVLRQYRVSR